VSGKWTIAVDTMSGDAGATVIVEAVAAILKRRRDIHLLLVGDPATVQPLIDSNRLSADHVTLVAASEVVTMEDSTAIAMRQKKDSSMRVAINQVKSGHAAAAVSAGNTGALMAISRFVLKTLPGIDRPAIISTIPAVEGHTHMLDLGANVDCTPEHLYQFAVMGSILAGAIDNVGDPKIGLLNIGSEEIKGNEQIREAAKMIAESSLNYAGFIEGNEIFTQKADVVVCDGFVGNVALKTSEGVATVVSHYLREEFKRTLWNKLVSLMAMPILKAFRQRIDPRVYNGASLLGLQGVVIKSHGSADAFAFANAIDIARLEIQNDVPKMIGKHISSLLPAQD